MDEKRKLSIRVLHALNQVRDKEELDRRLSVSPATISKWINGHVSNLKSAHLFTLAELSKISARWIALGEGPEQVLETNTENEDKALRCFRRLDKEAQEQVLSMLALLASTQFTGDEDKKKKFQESISSEVKASA